MGDNLKHIEIRAYYLSLKYPENTQDENYYKAQIDHIVEFVLSNLGSSRG